MILGICTLSVQFAMPYPTDFTELANDPACQVPATFLGVGRQSFLQKQAFFAKKGCLPPKRLSGARAHSHLFAEKEAFGTNPSYPLASPTFSIPTNLRRLEM
jgi:hypothetical protein